MKEKMKFVRKWLKKWLKPDFDEIEAKIQVLNVNTKPERLFKSSQKALMCIFVDEKRYVNDLSSLDGKIRDLNFKVMQLRQDLDHVKTLKNFNLCKKVKDDLVSFEAILNRIDTSQSGNEHNIALLFSLLDQIKK